jgi:hypothetical protein
MNMVLAVFLVAAVAVLAALVAVLLKAASQKAPLPATADWIDEVSVERYRPMLRLLEEDDFEFVRSRPGSTPQIVAQLRRQRCQIFRGYLESLRCDFGRVSTALRLVMVQAGHDRPDLARTVVRAHVAFTFGIVAVQVRLALYSWGLGSVSAASVLGVFDNLRRELRTLVPAGMHAGV